MSRYYTYHIEVFTTNRVLVKVRNQQNDLIAEPHGVFSYDASTKEKLHKLHQSAREGHLSGALVEAFGEALFNALFDENLRRDFFTVLRKATRDDALLRIDLEIDDKELPDVASLPWEFARIPSNQEFSGLWLATSPKIILSRRRALWEMPESIELDADERLRIGLAVADPDRLGPIKYERIANVLKKVAKQSSGRIELIDILDHANAESIDALLEQEPQIFHFIGHGRLHNGSQRETGEVALVDDLLKTPVWVGAEQFAEIFNRHVPSVVVLQACEGGALSSSDAFAGVASQLVQRNIPIVIAMQYQISNITAQRFALKFYQRLVGGDPVDKAVQEARRHIALGRSGYQTRDFATPVIFMRVREGYLFQRLSFPVEFEPHTRQEQILYSTPPLRQVDLDLASVTKHQSSSNIVSYEKTRSQPQIFDILDSLQAERGSIPWYVLEYLFPSSGLMLGPDGKCPLWSLAQNGMTFRLTTITKLIIEQLQDKRFRNEYGDERFRSLLWSKVLLAFADSQRGFINRSLATLSQIESAINGIGISEIMAWHANVKSIVAGKLGLESQATTLAAHAIFVAEACGVFWLVTVIKLRMLHRTDWHKWETGKHPDHSAFEADLASSVKNMNYADPAPRLHIEALRSSVEVLHYSWSPSESNRALILANNTLSLLSSQPDHAERARMISEIGRIKLFSLKDPVNALPDLKQGALLLASSGNLARLRYYLSWLAEAYLKTEDKDRSALCAQAALFLHNKLYHNTKTDLPLVETITTLLSQDEKTVGNLMTNRSLYSISNSLAEATGIDALWWFNILYDSDA